MKTLALLELEFALAVMQGCAEPIFMLPVRRKKACCPRPQQKRYVHLPDFSCLLCTVTVGKYKGSFIIYD